MFKYFLFPFMLIPFTQLFAQIETDLDLETQSGYEQNIFRFPKTFFDEEQDTLLGPQETYRSSLYQSVNFRLLFTKTFGKQELTFRTNPQGRYYFEDEEASYYTLYNRLRYQNRLSRKTQWNVTARFNFRDRDGENLDDSDLRFPLGYTHLEISSGLNFRAYKQNRSYLEVRSGNRNYKDATTDALQYNFLGVHFTYRNVFKRVTGYHSYGVEIEATQRSYSRVYIDPDRETDRFNWFYTSVEGFYRCPIAKNWQLRPSLIWTRRKDNKETFSYSEIRPGASIRYNESRFSMRFNASYTLRNFDVLRATDSDNTDLGALRFGYTRFRLEASYPIAKNMYLEFDGYWNGRNSNRTNVNKLFFRSYEYYHAGFGVKLDL
ncbi:MAG: hypothetical protein AAFP76_00750 [Bacteroidota bacterium]